MTSTRSVSGKSSFNSSISSTTSYGIFLSGRIDGIICTDDEHKVGIWEVVIQFVHFKNNIIWDPRLSKQYVQLSRHTTSDRMDTKATVDAVFADSVDKFSNGVLSFSNSQTIPWNNDDVLGCSDQIYSVGNIHFSVGSSDLHLFSCSRCECSIPSKQHITQGAVHCFTHNVGQDTSRETDKSSNDGQQIVVQHEPFCTESPSTVTVQHSDDDWHVSTSDGCSHVDSHHGRQTGSSSQHGETNVWIITVHEHTKSSDTSSCHTDVQRVLDWEVQGYRGEESLKLSKGCQ